MDNILVSIIVPAYNIKQYIGRCLDSILRQSHRLIEVIVVDDGSTDGTWEVIEQYAAMDHRVVPVHKDNGGVSSARLIGLSYVKGEYIGFVDGDDYIEENMYSYLLANAIKYCADISHCGYQMIYPDGHIDFYYGTEQIREQNHEDGLRDLLQGNLIEPSLGNKLYYKGVIEGFVQSRLWDQSIRINEDLLMNYLFFKKAHKSVYDDKVLYHYILRKGSAATTKRERYKILDPLKVITCIKDDVVGNKELEAIVYQRYLRILINISIQQEWKKDAAQAKKQLKKETVIGNLNNLCTSNKLKLMVIGVTYFSGIYRIVRKCYERITGISKKYVV